MPTRKTNPLALNVLEPDNWRQIEGQDVQEVYDATAEAFEKIRTGNGPFFFWINMERLSSHTSSDDQKLYRSAEELRALEKFDPLKGWKDRLIEESLITAEQYAKLDDDVKERIRREYTEAEKAGDPSPNELLANVTAPPPQIDKEILPPGKYRIGDTVNKTLRLGLEKDTRRILFGEDIEDPKGGVFRLTQNLSTGFPKQVFNSPLAESTILGVACGLAAYGKRPVFELQFIDFIYPGFNQLVTNIANLRWRSFGNWKCPAVIYAPYGAYLPGGSLWHSQANESVLAHYPGLNVVIPSTPADAAGLLWTAMHCEDPVIFLIPKHLLWAEHEYTKPIRAVPLGRARTLCAGSDVTLVCWGNTVEKSLEALEKIGNEISVELIDPRSIVPLDKAAIEQSVRKTRRLVVVQEDTENCSVGQMIISHVTSTSELWNEMISPPVLVSKANVMIGYNPIYEYAALPDVDRIVSAIRRSIATKHERIAVGPTSRDDSRRAAPEPEFPEPGSTIPATADAGKRQVQSITVPVMGEGIRNAKVVSLLKKPGDPIELDDELCEVETDKAVYPIQSSFAGVMGEWKTKVGDTVEIGQELGTILTGEGAESALPAAQSDGEIEAPAARSTASHTTQAFDSRSPLIRGDGPQRPLVGEPAPIVEG